MGARTGKAYGALRAVHDVSFEVAKGEIFGIFGPNGSGETTTVECLQGLRRADGGDIAVLGLDPRTQVAELRRGIGSQRLGVLLAIGAVSWAVAGYRLSRD